MYILITGGAGFIGSHIAKQLTRDGHTVTIYDNLSTGSLTNVRGFYDQCEIEFVRGDILDYPLLKRTVAVNDITIHHAAQLEITTSINDPLKDATTNIIGSLNVLRACKECGVRKLINASSACVYGEPMVVPSREDSPTNPNWEYGISKLSVEKYCDLYARSYGVNIASLRYSIVYGVNEWYGRALTIFLKRAIDGKPPVVFGEGLAQRDLINVEDAASFSRSLVETGWEGHEIFNVSSGESVSIRKLAQTVNGITGNDEIIFEPVGQGERSKEVEGRTRLPRELSVMHLDNSKAKEMCNWTPIVSLREGIHKEYEWIKNNPHRWNEMSY